MPVLTLGYRHCARKRPLFLKNSEIESIAVQVRQQLVEATTAALSLAILNGISGLRVNGIVVDLFVGTGEVVHDEQGNPVLGICEYDPGVPDTAIVSVSPVGDYANEELVLSTLGHELGHAIFDAPGWIVDASKGPGLFDDLDESGRRAYRTTTRDVEHMAKVSPPAGNADAISSPTIPGHTSREEYFAELRANEFMGSLLVPRHHLNLAVENLAPQHGITIHRSPSLDPEVPGTSLHLMPEGDLGPYYLECLQKALAEGFGVNRRFIQVRMQRYGLLNPGAQMV